MDINGNEISFDSRPKHGMVMRVRSLETTVLQKYIDVTKLAQADKLQEVVQKEMMANVELREAMAELQASKHLDQTILLSAHMDGKPLTYEKLQQLKDVMYEEEYMQMFEEAKAALGDREAKDFFSTYRGNIDLNNPLIAKMMGRNLKPQE